MTAYLRQFSKDDFIAASMISELYKFIVVLYDSLLATV